MRKGDLTTVFVATALAFTMTSCAHYGDHPPQPEGGKPVSAGALILDGKEVPLFNSKGLKEFLDEGQYSTITLVNNRGEVKIVNVDGKQIEPCGTIEGTTITGTCHLEGIDVMHVNDVSIWVTHGSPTCGTIRVNGRILQVHATAEPGHWNRGNWPCHEGTLADHQH